MPMFPDSGVPAGDAKNSIDVNTIPGCPELWYSTSRCAPRFDPAAANALLAEAFNLIMKGEVVYDCANLNHVERATRYIVQRGLPTGAFLGAGAFDYTFILDPPLTRYNNYMTLTIVPNQTNQGPVRLDGGLGLVPLLRNDGLQLEFGDLRAGVPTLISYWNGYWYHIGLCSSQVPIVVKGAVDIWVRTDGNDATGDGSANSADKAFRTISGAWNRVGARFAATPLFTMNIKLGIPGTYKGCALGPFGGRVSLSGPNPGFDNRADYRISCFDFGNRIEWGGMFLEGLASISFTDITFIRDVAPPFQVYCIRGGNSGILLRRVDFITEVSNPMGCFVSLNSAAVLGYDNGDFTYDSKNTPIAAIIDSGSSSSHNGSYHPDGANIFFKNIPIVTGGQDANNLGFINWGNTRIFTTNCSGPQYLATANSIIQMYGRVPPGTVIGRTETGGQYIA